MPRRSIRRGRPRRACAWSFRSRGRISSRRFGKRSPGTVHSPNAPVTRAYVYTVLPSLFASLKLSSTGEIIGTFLQDRATAIAGRLGPAPHLIPITLTLESGRAPKRTFHFGVV